MSENGTPEMDETIEVAETPTLTDIVKVALRISHNKLDDEIGATIEAAKHEMQRAGIEAPDEEDPLILEAIKVYCKHSFAADEKRRDGFLVSWQYQLDNLRKSKGYGWDDV